MNKNKRRNSLLINLNAKNAKTFENFNQMLVFDTIVKDEVRRIDDSQQAVSLSK